MLLGSSPVPMNKRLRTGAEKENPPVPIKAKPLRWSETPLTQCDFALNVKVMLFIQARINGDCNYDSLKVAQKIIVFNVL